MSTLHLPVQSTKRTNRVDRHRYPRVHALPSKCSELCALALPIPSLLAHPAGESAFQVRARRLGAARAPLKRRSSAPRPLPKRRSGATRTPAPCAQPMFKKNCFTIQHTHAPHKSGAWHDKPCQHSGCGLRRLCGACAGPAEHAGPMDRGRTTSRCAFGAPGDTGAAVPATLPAVATATAGGTLHQMKCRMQATGRPAGRRPDGAAAEPSAD